MSTGGLGAADATPLTELAAVVRELQAGAGNPSARSIGKATGVSHTTVSEVLTGRRLASWDVVRRIGLYLNAEERALKALWDDASLDDPRAIIKKTPPLDIIRQYRSAILYAHSKLHAPFMTLANPAGDFDEKFVSPTISQITSRTGNEGQEISFEDFSKVSDRAVLLGQPGSGKTSMATALLRLFAKSDGGPVPFLVRLRDLADESPPKRSITDYIDHDLYANLQLDLPARFTHSTLTTTETYVIFDGLDEIPPPTERRSRVSKMLALFGAKYPKARILVTSRDAGYLEAPLEMVAREFRLFRIRPLSAEQVGRLVHGWFAELDDSPDANATKRQRFMQEIGALRDFQQSPLLLSYLCTIFLTRGDLPKNRLQLYRMILDLSLSTWDASRSISTGIDTRPYSFEILKAIAFNTLESASQDGSIGEIEAESAATEKLRNLASKSFDTARLGAHEAIRWLRERPVIFTPANPGMDRQPRYRFAYKTLLDYLAASHLVEDSDSPTDLALEVFHRIDRTEWHDAIRQAVELADESYSDGALRTLRAMSEVAIAEDSTAKVQQVLDLLNDVATLIFMPSQGKTALTQELRARTQPTRIDEAPLTMRPQTTQGRGRRPHRSS